MEQSATAVGEVANTAVRITPMELCDRYGSRVYRFAAMVAGGRQGADDLAQDALERAIRALPKFDADRGEIEVWLWRIVVNAGRDAGRIAKRQDSLHERIVALTARPSPSPSSLPPGVRDPDLLAAVRTLKPRQRSLIALRFGADLDYRHIGRALGISAAAANVGVSRALVALRMRLDPSSKQGAEAHGKP